MKKFLQVFRFELAGFVGGKWYRVSTIVICLLLVGVMFLPRVMDMSNDSSNKAVSETDSTIGVYDPTNVFADDSALKAAYPKATIDAKTSEDELRRAIQAGDVDMGFYVESATTYQYIILDRSVSDSSEYVLQSLMDTQYRMNAMKGFGLNEQQVTQVMTTPIVGDTVILGTDGAQNYMYTYLLVFLLYFVIMFYGQMTATNVASEKGNRAMEILVTSTSSNSLIFGKVLAGAVAGIIQIAALLGISMLSYQANVVAWDHALDFIFNIPVSVLCTFAVFGTLGYLFYSFIYGALGAMVSKVEEVSSAVTPVTLLMILSFFATFFFVMMQPESIISVIATYLPFSSCMAMFARVAMGSVALWEIILSAAILAVSTIAIGLIGAKLYRHGTLSYGNTFKFSKLIHIAKKKED